MRIGETRTARAGRGEAPTVGFDDALRRARDVRESARPGRAQRARAGDRAVATASADEARSRAEAGGAGARSDPIDLEPPRALADPAPVPEIAALVRTVPAAVAAACARQGGPLSLSFGRALEVELRSGAAGVEILLRPEARLAHVAEAELPRALAALRVRGVRIARAEVRPRGEARRRAR